eukprot:Unigene1351_Nuclearia_a/m.4294 Unigene1351_Nuclearia_a/g.4294  ORF Unigene1351_Nuclearia_a/g.4294 Unigene1351_Nuclearia_a/m.4294 type:complete len:395 (-) Unigene1351_Nuclearia_a:47-1231(-)
MRAVYIVAAKRTPFGAFGGSLKDHSATDLAVHAAKAALAESKAPLDAFDTVNFGNVQQTSNDAAYLARHVGLRAGLPVPVPALTVNRLCGSGFQAVINSMQEIQLGLAELSLAGGTESMSQAPYVVRGTRFGAPLGANIPFEDSLWAGLYDTYPKLPMGMTAENLAAKYNVTREESDKFGLRSQTRYAQAHKAGVFRAEIAPMEVKMKKGPVTLDKDEGPRETSLEALQKLKPTFKKDGVVTAGSASGITDGAAALVLASEDAVKKYGLKPLARIVSYHYAGVDPSIMGIGPCPAVQGALKKASLSLDKMDLLEVNEAFAPQVIAVARELKIDVERLNKNGGAISLGHPLGASGARITSHLTHDLIRTKGKYAVGSACIGGGQGIAIVLENVHA